MKRTNAFFLRLFALPSIALCYPAAESLAQPGGPPKTSPLAAYSGFGHNDRADEARFTREEGERERAIASCMRDAGFRYNPAPSVAVTCPMPNPAGRSALIEEYETMMTEVRADARVKQAEAKWAECATSKALPFVTPTAAHADLDLNPQGSAARRLLIAECAASSSLNETAADVRAEHEARFVTRHKTTLEQKKGAL